MECTTETMPAMSVMGLARRFTDEAAFTEIPKFWEEYHAQGMDKTLCCYLGVCIEEPGEPDFTYMIARFCEADAPVPEGYVKHVLPAHTWAKFRTMDALRMYDLPAILIGSNDATRTVSMLVVDQTRQGFNSASALSTLTFLLIFAVAFVLVKLLGANAVRTQEDQRRHVRVAADDRTLARLVRQAPAL